jgi:hypothetical protein
MEAYKFVKRRGSHISQTVGIQIGFKELWLSSMTLRITGFLDFLYRPES